MLHRSDLSPHVVPFLFNQEDEEEYEEEEFEEIEEEIIEDKVQTMPKQTMPKQAPMSPGPSKLVYADIQKAKGGLRKAPVSPYKLKDDAAAARVAANAPIPSFIPTPAPSQERAVRKPKTKVRPPPEKGGMPKPRNDPVPVQKSPKKFPLSRLLQRNQKSAPTAPALAKPESAPETAPPVTAAASAAAPTEGEPKKKKIMKRVVRKKPPAAVAASNDASGGAPGAKKPTPGGPFKRRVIPNIQPSPAGEETAFEQLLGPKLITNPKMHKCGTKGCVKDQELIGLYVAANWKSDCKRFGPLIKDFYYNAAPHNNLEIVYISADRSLSEFKDFYTTTPFLAMPAGTSSIKNELTKALKIIEMPALVILDEDGDVVTVEGVQKIQELERGNVEQANQLVERWKKTRPIPISDVQKDNTLLHGTMDRGYVYWN